MNKQFYRFLSVFIAILMLFTTNYTHAEATKDGQAREESLNQAKAMAAHECLLNSFNLINGVGYGYPDDFGGDYIDGDKLCVFVATTNAEIIERYKSILIDYIDAIEFIKVKHSYNYLYTLCEKYANELAQKFIVTGYYVDIKENTAVICINPVEHRLALQYLDKNKRSEQNSIELKAEAETEPTATLYGGDRINFNGTDQASLSICGTYNTSNAIATCGHSLVDYYYVYNGTSTTTQIGVKCVAQYKSGEYGDYGISTVMSSHTTTNKVLYYGGTRNITGVYASPAVGTIVYKYGATTGYGYGTVDAVNHTLSSGVRGITRVVLSSGTCAGGDSGGTVYMLYNGEWVYCGIIVARSTADNTIMYITPAFYVISAGFTPKIN